MPELLDVLARVPTGVWTALSVLSILLAGVSALLVPRIVARLPEDLLLRPPPPPLLVRLLAGPPRRSAIILLRNLAGLCLVGLGVAMLFLPGQGVITIVTGLALVDLPGRRRLLLRLLRAPGIRRVVTHLRRRAGVPPLLGLDR